MLTLEAPDTTDSRAPRRTTAVRRGIDRLAEWLSERSWLQLTLTIILSSLIMCLALLGQNRNSLKGTMNLMENWGAIERLALWQDWLNPVVPRYTLPAFVVAWLFRFAFLSQFLAQAAVFLKVMTSRNPSFARWMIGPVVAHLIQLVLMVPTNSDVFFYETVGDFAAHGFNPYISKLAEWPDHPLVPFNYWIDIGTVYGPHWINYNLLVMRIVHADPIAATLVQKALCGIFAIAIAALVYVFCVRLTAGNQRVAVAAAMFVAWQPNMILESSGQVHNDLHTVFIATLGLVITVLGGIAAVRAGVVLITLSLLIKFITAPLLGVIAVLRVVDRRRPNGFLRIFGNWALDGIAIIAMVLAGFLPWWAGSHTLDEMKREPDRLYTHPIWRGIQASLEHIWGWNEAAGPWTDFTRPLLKYGAMLTSLAIVVWLGWRLFVSRQTRTDTAEDEQIRPGIPWWTRPMLYAWMFEFMALSFITVNSHPWYWVWPVSAVAMVIAFDFGTARQFSVRMLPSWFWLYFWFSSLMTLAYHARIAHG